MKRKKIFSLIKSIILFDLGLLINAICFNLLENPAKIVTGGSTGIAIILEETIAVKPTITVFWLSTLGLVLSLLFLNFEKTIGAFISLLFFPMFVNLTSKITNYITIDMSNTLVIAIFIGVIYGIGGGLIYKSGFNSGGTATIHHILYKYFRIPLATSSFIMNGIIILIGGFYFGWSMVMYAIILLYIYSIISNKVLLGSGKNKNIYIISNHESEIKEYILNNINSGLTEFDVKGGISFSKKKVIMTAVTNNKYFKLKEGVKQIDKKAFMIVTDSYQVSERRI